MRGENAKKDIIYIFTLMQPKTHKAAFMVPGLCSYESDGNGIWKFDKVAIDDSINSFIGKPVQIGHDIGTPESGYVCGVYFDEQYGFYVATFFLLDEKAEEMINSGKYYPSCFYVVEEESGAGGVYNEIAYSNEILKARFDHLAIVETPRYSCGTFDFEQAAMQNSGEKPNFELKAINSGGKMSLFVKNKTAKNEGEEKKKEENNPPPPPAEGGKAEEKSVMNAVVEIDGQKVPVADLAELYRKTKASENEGEEVIGENETVDIDGNLVKISDLIALWKGSQTANDTEEEKEVEKTEEENKCPNCAKNAAPKKNGLNAVRKAVTASNSCVKDFNSRYDRLPNESRKQYNERITKLVF
jgi:hypothetical protein